MANKSLNKSISANVGLLIPRNRPESPKEQMDRLHAQQHPGYRLFLFIRREFHLATDAELARFLGLKTAVVSKVRHGRSGVTAAMVITAHEKTCWPVAKIKELAGQA